MEVLKLILTILQVLGSLFLITVVLLQSGKRQGLSGAIGGGAETFFGKNKGRAMDALPVIMPTSASMSFSSP